ncbi:MAG TPA: hypothetical protein VJ761_08150 [Ktedonobacteraceae bacterium]|nr:hypothetical protein [Ktedonobacteraceae bacterium]
MDAGRGPSWPPAPGVSSIGTRRGGGPRGRPRRGSAALVPAPGVSSVVSQQRPPTRATIKAHPTSTSASLAPTGTSTGTRTYLRKPL